MKKAKKPNPFEGKRRILYEVLPIPKAERERQLRENAAAGRMHDVVDRWQITRDKLRIATKATKREAVEMAVITARCAWTKCQQISELTIKLFNGKVEDKRTYPRSSDPRGSKG